MTLNIDNNLPSRPVISASQWRYILKLVGLMAVANNRLVKEDTDAFLDEMMELRAVVDPSLVMTRRMLLDWFLHNKAELKAVIQGLEYDSELIAIFKEIRAFPYKLDVLTAMMRVGIADGDFGKIEKMFINKSILYWNVRSAERANAADALIGSFDIKVSNREKA